MGLLYTEVHGMSMDRVSIFPYLHLSIQLEDLLQALKRESKVHLRGKSKSLKALSFNLTPCRMMGLLANTDTSTFSSCDHLALNSIILSYGTDLSVQIVPEL